MFKHKLKNMILILALFACSYGGKEADKETKMPVMTNHLINETSPYLLQHVHNPVDWYPWGDEALALAKKQNKPIFLSIGYSACHWCHVMEHESFEDPETAALMNELFINIKVDREERPDIDQVYMRFVQMSTGSGGWPMSVFLTADQKPFFGGTYFPPEDRYGKPGFKKLLEMVSDFYYNKKNELQKNLNQMEQAFEQSLAEDSSGAIPDKQAWLTAAEQLSRFYEPEFGGIGNAPKFPAVQGLSLFLRAYKNTGQQHYLDMVEFTLKNMAEGGIYDQLAGGFARYSVDKEWFAPHFEKMLYDNAQLANLYLDTYLVTKNEFYLKISNEILEFVHKEMTSAEGGFYSSIDADSEGQEGLYYLWTREEIDALLDKESADVFCKRYDVRQTGNFESRNILHINQSIEELSKEFNLSHSEVEDVLSEANTILLKEREKRISPALDKKVIVSWNGLMVSAFARNVQLTKNSLFRETLKKNIQLMQNKLITKDGLLHTYKDGQAKHSAFLDDYANWIQGLLDAWEATFDGKYLQSAMGLTQQVNERFWDPIHKGYFYTSANQEQLIQRMKDDSDQSIPSGTGIMALNLLRLYSFSERQELLDIAEQIFSKYGADYSSNPYGYASHLNALNFYLNKPKEILLVLAESKMPNHLLEGIFGQYNPNKVVLIQEPNTTPNPVLTAGLFQGRSVIDQKATAYVCHNFSCSLPITTKAELLSLLK